MKSAKTIVSYHKNLLQINFLLCFLLFSQAFPSDDSERLKFNGDFRYRFDISNQDNDDVKARSRHRIRARFGFKVKISDENRIIFQLASGSDDLVSSNQTLSGTFSSKNIVMDLAYGVYKPLYFKGKMTLLAGKTILPFVRPGKTELLWDSDLRPEGITSLIDFGLKYFNLNVITGFYSLEEREDDDNSYLYASQLIASLVRKSKFEIKTGIGYFHFTEIKDRSPFVNDDFKGNSFYTDTTIIDDSIGLVETTQHHLYDYHEFEILTEISFQGFNKQIKLMSDLVFNLDPDNNNVGWLVGFSVGEVTERNTWKFRYNYRRLEKDVAYANFTSSVFANGGTDSQGHEFGLNVGLMKNMQVSISYFNNKVRLEDKVSYQRFLLDISSSF